MSKSASRRATPQWCIRRELHAQMMFADAASAVSITMMYWTALTEPARRTTGQARQWPAAQQMDLTAGRGSLARFDPSTWHKNINTITPNEAETIGSLCERSGHWVRPSPTTPFSGYAYFWVVTAVQRQRVRS